MRRPERRLTIYLHPDRGCITPVELDLLDSFATLSPPRPADPLGDDELRRLCDAIRRHQPGVQPESNLDGLRRIYANFGHADRFDGVALRVRGTIECGPDAGPGVSVEQVEAIKAEIRRRDRRIEELEGSLRREQRARGEREPLLEQCTDLLQRTRQELEAVRQTAAAQIAAAGAEASRQVEAVRQDLGRERIRAQTLATRVRHLEETLAAREQDEEPPCLMLR